jgi:hypothetical protein
MADGTDFNDFAPKVGNEAIKEKIEQAAQVKESDQETIARLAKLSIEAYEGKRRDEAEKLNWRVSILDRAVDKERQKLLAERRAAEFAERQEEEQPVLCPDLGEEDHLVLIDQAIRDLGYGGDTKLPKLLYLSYTSRLLAFDIGNMLAHGQVVGPPSSGKN